MYFHPHNIISKLYLSQLFWYVEMKSFIYVSYFQDPVALEKYIKDDLSATKTPLVVLANAGLPLLGHVDDLQKIHEICAANNVWLHLHGHCLAGLTLLAAPKVVQF